MELTITKDGSATRIALKGSIDEDADFGEVLRQLAHGGRFILDLAGVPRINSSGVREWVHFVQTIKANAAVELVNCPPMFVDQAGVLTNFLGPTRVKSLQVPFFCDGCSATSTTTISAESALAGDPPPPSCSQCDGEMEYDVITDLYFRFLRT